MIVILLPLALSATAPMQRAAAAVPPGGQVGRTADRETVAAEQITPFNDSDSIDQLPRDTRQRPVMPQIIASPLSGDARQPPNPVTRDSTIAALQLDPATRSASAPPSPALRADGRHTEIVRVGGTDRCDPQAPQAYEARCRRVIETRSAEFERPAPPALSPEQRLLLDQESRSMRGVSAATQRIARNEVDPEAADTQALAAISGGQPADANSPSPSNQQQPSGTETIIQIIEAARGARPNP